MGTGKFLSENKVMFCADLQPKTQEWSKSGDSVVYIAVDEKHVASMSLGDDLRPESKSAIDQLHQLGVKTAMLTGDNEQVAQAVATKLNIDTYFANVLPENKYKHIKDLQNQGNSVMMVGDGVNDAPALTQANVGVAIGAGTEVAVEAGDVVLTRNNPQDIVGLVVLARKVYRKMIENLIWALGYNIVAIPAAAGLFIPWGFRLRPEIGALLMSLSSVIVVINALALKKIKLSA
jgi:Cu2+-exporting ATPase